MLVVAVPIFIVMLKTDMIFDCKGDTDKMEINLDTPIAEETDKKKMKRRMREDFGKMPKIRTPLPTYKHRRKRMQRRSR